MQRVLITGAGGMLAQDVISVLGARDSVLTLTDLEASEGVDSLDITDANGVDKALAEVDWVVNCAAYTAVDKAEEEPVLANAVNALGAANLARASERTGAKLLHVSTDYVFGGELTSRGKPYREEEPMMPCGVYGQSKAEGEEQIRSLCPDKHIIVRTSWLHGTGGPNFLQSMLRLGAEREHLRIVDDQIGSPTYTVWLAEVIRDLIFKDVRGTFHASSRGNISWKTFAEEIFRQAGLKVEVESQTTAELGRPAPRPAYSTLDVGKLEQVLVRDCPDWKQFVSVHLQAL